MFECLNYLDRLVAALHKEDLLISDDEWGSGRAGPIGSKHWHKCGMFGTKIYPKSDRPAQAKSSTCKETLEVGSCEY